MATKDLATIFKALSLHVDDEKLKDWADEADEEGEYVIDDQSVNED